MNKKCCFAGHSTIYSNEKIYNDLIKVIEQLITEKNVCEFYVGNYGDFDGLCARVVRNLKKEKFPHIELNLVVPYITIDINEYKEVYYKNYDNILMADIPISTPHRLRIIKCNEYMVQKCNYIICYIKHSWGGARKTFEYAQKRKNISIINIAENDCDLQYKI